ncbi:MAG TPA: GGDEF domain-containing protein [Mycobacteriales bacterium]|jgi:diguanylate cyclase (GGDEF)-like protein
MNLRRNATTWVRTIAGTRAEPAAPAATTYLATEAKRDVDVLQAALHDPVTGLPERALLLDRIALALARARRANAEVAVLLLAIDQLDGVRATIGAPHADRLLREFAERVLRAVRDTDTVARFGPNEFAVLCDGVEDRDTLMIVAGRIASGLTKPFQTRGGDVALDVGMEIVLVDGDTPPVALLDLAEQAIAATRLRREGGG